MHGVYLKQVELRYMDSSMEEQLIGIFDLDLVIALVDWKVIFG